MGDEEHFPCHFGYKTGDEFVFDGEKFIGRVCPGLLAPMVPIITAIYHAGNRYCERMILRYSGLSMRDSSMEEYDGAGYRPIQEPPKSADKKYTEVYSAKLPAEKGKGWSFACSDTKTTALFRAEPFGLAELGSATPYYRREMSIFENIKAEPGIGPDEILNKFSKWEREEIYPPLTTLMLEMMLDELTEANYIDIRGGKAYPKSSSK